MIFGHALIPIVSWMRSQATEALGPRGGSPVSTSPALGGHPSLAIGKLLETHKHDIDQILREALEHELEGIAAYRRLLKQTEGKSVVLEEYARKMVHGEETHVMDIEKMLRCSGEARAGALSRYDSSAAALNHRGLCPGARGLRALSHGEPSSAEEDREDDRSGAEEHRGEGERHDAGGTGERALLERPGRADRVESVPSASPRANRRATRTGRSAGRARR